MAYASGNPMVTRFRMRLAERSLESLLCLYGYGVFYLVRSFEGRFLWTATGPPESFDEEVYFYDIVATTEA